MNKRVLFAAALPAALVGLSACSTYDGYGYGYGGYGYGGYGYSSVYDDYYDRPYYGSGLSYYDVYYDNFYGPIHGGYWGPDNFFYYQVYGGGPYIRDYGRHFRRDRYNGFYSYRTIDPRRDWDRDRDRDRDRDWDRDRDRDRDSDRNPPSLWRNRPNADANPPPPPQNNVPSLWRNRPNNAPPQAGRSDDQLEGAPRNRDGRNEGNRRSWQGEQSPPQAAPPPSQQARPPRGNDDRGGRGRGNGQSDDDRSGGNDGGGKGERRTPSLWKNRPN